MIKIFVATINAQRALYVWPRDLLYIRTVAIIPARIILDPPPAKIINKNILVLSGGGVKGMALIGALKALEDLDILKHIKTF